MNVQELERNMSLDCVPWNEAGRLERSNSERNYNHNDLSILEHLHYLTQRVDHLEHKLENSLSGYNEELSFGLSVGNESDVPNVDIKVLSGPQDAGGMHGWDDAIVEQNTSFLIIPVGDDKNIHTNQELVKQVFGASVKPSRPALCSPVPYQEFIRNNDESRELLPPPPEMPSQTSSISMEIRPPRATTYVQSLPFQSTVNSYPKEEGNKSLKDKEKISLERTDSGRMQHVNNQERETTDSMSKVMTTSSPQQDWNNTTSLKYGYTVSITRRPIIEDNKQTPPCKDHLSDPGVTQHPKHISTIQSDILNTLEDQQTASVSTSTIPNYVVKSSDLQTQESICHQDVELCEVIEYEDTLKYDNGNDTTDRTVVKIRRRISNENCVYPPATTCTLIDNRLQNTKQQRKDSKDSLIEKTTNEDSSGVDDECLIQKELQDLSVTSDNSDDSLINMQISKSSSNPCQDVHCVEVGSNGPVVPENNAPSKRRLTQNNDSNNTNSLKDTDRCAGDEEVIQRSAKHHVINTKPGVRKIRVSSVDIFTSSDDDVCSVSSDSIQGSYSYRRQLRLPRRKPQGRSHKGAEDQLRELIDQRCKVREEVQVPCRPPLLLAVMSPTESGYVGSSQSSPLDDYKDSERYSNGPYSPVSTTGSYSTYVEGGHVEYYPSHRMPYLSVTSPTSASDESEYSEPPESQNLSHFSSPSLGNARLNDVLPGPARLSLSECSPTQLRLNEFLLSATDERPMASPASSVITSDLSDSFLDCHEDCCQCQTGISTEDDFREELKEISRYVIEAGANSGFKKKRVSQKKYYLDEEQGEMDIFGAKLQKGEHRAVPLLVKVILRLRKHFFGGFEGPHTLKALSPKQTPKNLPQENGRARKISFSPSAMLLSAVEESSASEIREVIEKERLDVNELSPSGKTMLHKAAASGNLDTIHTLIQYGALVNLPDEDGFVAIHAALRQCHYKCAVFLIECGTDIGSYTKARIQELADINNISRAHKRTVLNTAL